MSEPYFADSISLCSGYGGLDLAAAGAVVSARPRWHAEIEPAAAAVFERHWPGVPNLGDITTCDWAGIHADILTAGYPCQPDSLAGKGLSTDDHRWIWPDVARAISCVGPRLVLLENVAGHLVRGFPTVLGSLADLGYDARWTTLRASDVGAPHERRRVFIVAWPAGDANRATRGQRWVAASRQAEAGWAWPDAGGPGGASAADADGQHAGTVAARDRRGEPEASARDSAPPASDTSHGADNGQWARTESRQGSTATSDTDSGQGGIQPVAEPGRSGAAVAGQPVPAADAQGDGRHEGRPEPTRLIGRPDVAECGDAADPDSAFERRRAARRYDGIRTQGLEPSDIQWGRYEPAIRRWERISGRVAPAPTEPNTRGGRRLSPAFVEWMMGLPAGWVTDTPGITRNDQLRILGNGVVPQQAAAAYRWLLAQSRLLEAAS